ncbi:glucosaminidase domain-containing protein [Spongiimicrobium sp. 3-5]|uniref:glucosaminidase domain-containing protein n=1 Tax=Spongiimicrobium sp. 3-5 TaxID=3332596 RepID=UPI00397F121E
MRKIGILLFMVFFVISCGTKKRTTYAKNKEETSKTTPTAQTPSTENKDDGLYPMPADTGKFVKFPISSVEEYIETFAEIAQFEMKAYGIPASITLAQGILESGFGRSELVRKTNNHFGIKCHKGWKGKYAYHDDDEKGECFRKYNHPMYSFRDHSEFLSSRARYAFLFDYRRDDYKRWAKGLKQAGYATDKRYPQKLISFIEQYRLHKYDKEVFKEGYVVETTPKTYDYQTYIVKKGDTLYSISRRYFVSVDELMRMNKMKNSGLSIGQELIVKSAKINK